VLQAADGQRTPASGVLRGMGYTAQVLARMAADKHRATLQWLNLKPTVALPSKATPPSLI
jgi:hypothetical protein